MLRIKGTAEILKSIEKKGYKIDTIYYRENYICNINYSKEEKDSKDFENVSFRFNDNLEVVFNRAGETYDSGIYKAAFIPDIATYPENLFD